MTTASRTTPYGAPSPAKGEGVLVYARIDDPLPAALDGITLSPLRSWPFAAVST